jgi:lysophospholipase L1-like esterase
MVVALLLLTFLGSWHPAAQFAASYPSATAAARALHPGHHAFAPPPPAPDPARPSISFEVPSAQLPAQPEVASVAIPGRAGIYLVPYIQTQPDLHFRLRVQELAPDTVVTVTLDAEGDGRSMDVTGPTFSGTFDNVAKGDHTLSAYALRVPQRVYMRGTDGGGDRVAVAHLTHVARGDIVSAIGDSTTEGNGGAVFAFLPNWVSALANAADWTSADGRNFPQAGAVAHPAAPASFTSTLGMLLESARGYPVLVLNDGWSGATAEAYAHITTSSTLAQEYAAVQPNSWVVNLGVNDPLTHQNPDQFDNSLHLIVQNLVQRYGAKNADIHIACPTYSRDSRHDGESGYLPVIDRYRASAALGVAPNFFAYYHDVPSALGDEVHPNEKGYRDMAVLWAQALAGRGASCT